VADKYGISTVTSLCSNRLVKEKISWQQANDLLAITLRYIELPVCVRTVVNRLKSIIVDKFKVTTFLRDRDVNQYKPFVVANRNWIKC
jgi:hypothetical protein